MSVSTHPPPTQTPDDDPVALVLAQPATRENLLRQVLALLHRKMAGSPIERRRQEAEEIVDEVVARVLSKRANYHPEIASVMAWISGFVNRTILERFRQAARERKFKSKFRHDFDESSIDITFDESTFHDMIQKIPESERTIITMFYIEELSHFEIAERLGITESNSRQRLRRTLAKVLPIVQDHYGEGQS